MKFRFKDDGYKYPENVTISWDMIEKDVERELEVELEKQDAEIERLSRYFELNAPTIEIKKRAKLNLERLYAINGITPKPWWKFW